MADWETVLEKAVISVRDELNKGELIQEESIKASLYFHLREKLEGSGYTIFTEFKYYWHHRPHHEGSDFDIAILRNWNPKEELKCTSNEDAKDYRYNAVVGLIEIKLASSLNRMLGKQGNKKPKSVQKAFRDKDIEKFRKLWRHPSHLRGVERAYLLLFVEGPGDGDWEDVEVPINDKDVPKEKIKVKSISCKLG